MPLQDFRHALVCARRRGFAVGAFNIIDFNSARAVVETAQQLEAPVICQTSTKTILHFGHGSIMQWMRDLAADTTVPVALHLDHGKDLDIIQACLDHGWTNVMIDASDLPFADNLQRSRQVFEMAARHDVGIEAEIGEIHGVEDDIVVENGGSVVDPDKAARFCAEIDLAVFAPAIGTAHGIYHGEPNIAWSELTEIHRRIPTPLALHGGTGLNDGIIQRCIGLGCAKINISTNLKHAFVDGFCNHRQEHPDDYEPLGFISSQDKAMRELIAAKITQFGGAHQAEVCLAESTGSSS